ncbi:MAG: DUF6966 domain-containing protein [Brevinematia bacterium]
MVEITQIKILLDEIYTLLLKANETEWAKSIYQIKNEFENSQEDELNLLARKALQMFEGSGSFSDLVLYVNGNPDSKLNDRFSTLRMRLHQELINFIS